MKQPKLKIHIGKHDDDIRQPLPYVRSRNTLINREPDIVHTWIDFDKDESKVKLWFGKEWAYQIDFWEPKCYGSLMECPRTGMLMWDEDPDYNYGLSTVLTSSQNVRAFNCWSYMNEVAQQAYRGYKATYELEQALANSK